MALLLLLICFALALFISDSPRHYSPGRPYGPTVTAKEVIYEAVDSYTEVQVHVATGRGIIATLVLNLVLLLPSGSAQSQHTLVALTTESQEAVLVGPISADTKIRISSLTFANTGIGVGLEVRVRGIQPSGGDCLGPGTVVDETTWVKVPPDETVHLPYPRPLITPQTSAPTGPWCLIVFFPPAPTFQTIPAGAEV